MLYSVKIVGESLTTAGVPFEQYGVTDDLPPLLARLLRRDFDVVFNLYEGAGDRSITEVYFTGLLEWLHIPYTGCPSFTLAVARSKPTSKRLMQAAGIRTAEFAVLHTETDPADVPLPAIVKPATEDASLGIEQGAVVKTEAELRARVRFVLDAYGPPVMVERYVAGRELQVSVIDLDGTGRPLVLPFAEIAFTPPSAGREWPIYTYTPKWHEESDEYKNAPVVVGAELPPAVADTLTDTARRVYHLLGARDYARVDTRVTPSGEVFVLELNPNPAVTSLMIDQGLPDLGFTYDQFISVLVRNAAARGVLMEGSRRQRANGAT